MSLGRWLSRRGMAVLLRRRGGTATENVGTIWKHFDAWMLIASRCYSFDTGTAVGV